MDPVTLAAISSAYSLAVTIFLGPHAAIGVFVVAGFIIWKMSQKISEANQKTNDLSLQIVKLVDTCKVEVVEAKDELIQAQAKFMTNQDKQAEANTEAWTAAATAFDRLLTRLEQTK